MSRTSIQFKAAITLDRVEQLRDDVEDFESVEDVTLHLNTGALGVQVHKDAVPRDEYIRKQVTSDRDKEPVAVVDKPHQLTLTQMTRLQQDLHDAGYKTDLLWEPFKLLIYEP